MGLFKTWLEGKTIPLSLEIERQIDRLISKLRTVQSKDIPSNGGGLPRSPGVKLGEFQVDNPYGGEGVQIKVYVTKDIPFGAYGAADVHTNRLFLSPRLLSATEGEAREVFRHEITHLLDPGTHTTNFLKAENPFETLEMDPSSPWGDPKLVSRPEVEAVVNGILGALRDALGDKVEEEEASILRRAVQKMDSSTLASLAPSIGIMLLPILYSMVPKNKKAVWQKLYYGLKHYWEPPSGKRTGSIY